jgi:RNA polymerase sigma-70 factor (ECF subfamily)
MGHDDGASRMDAERERSLVDRARSDGAAFGELYDYYLPRIHGFVARRVNDRATVEDLTAMTFERALEALRSGSFRNDAFGGWLYRVAGNAIVDHVRRDRRLTGYGIRASDGLGADDDTDQEPVRAVGGDAAAVDAFSASLDRDHLRQALLALPETHRRVLVLKFYDDLSTDELCAAFGCSPATFAVKLHRALRALRATLVRMAIDAA